MYQRSNQTIRTNSGAGVRINSNFYKVPVNNAIFDPFQGYDVDIWFLDQATGAYTIVGRFSSIQIVITAAMDPYLEFNHKLPRYFDSEYQISWSVERGMIDTRLLQQAFGFGSITRNLYLNRSPRFQISFSINAPELNQNPGPAGTPGNEDQTVYQNDDGRVSFTGFNSSRRAVGKLRLVYCKVGTLTINAVSGKAVVVNKWEGLAEGIEEVAESDADPGVWLDSRTAVDSYKAGAIADGVLEPYPWDNTNTVVTTPVLDSNSIPLESNSTYQVFGPGAYSEIYIENTIIGQETVLDFVNPDTIEVPTLPTGPFIDWYSPED